jgi:hypothetical protein
MDKLPAQTTRAGAASFFYGIANFGVMTCNKWLLLFAVRIRHAAASCSGAIFAGAGTAAAIKLSCILSAQFNYHRYF